MTTAIAKQEGNRLSAKPDALVVGGRRRTLRSPLESFVGQKYTRKYEGCGNTLYTIKVIRVAPADEDEKDDLNQPRLVCSVTQSTRGYSTETETLHKAEVVDHLDTSVQADLDATEHYELYNSLTSARFVSSTLFVLDVRALLAQLSELTQRDDMSLKSLARKLASLQDSIKLLRSKDSEGSLRRAANEQGFFDKYDADKEIYKGIQVLNEGLEEFDSDRDAFLDSLLTELQDPELQLNG